MLFSLVRSVTSLICQQLYMYTDMVCRQRHVVFRAVVDWTGTSLMQRHTVVIVGMSSPSHSFYFIFFSFSTTARYVWPRLPLSGFYTLSFFLTEGYEHQTPF